MYHHRTTGVAARSWRHLSLPLPASTRTLPRSLPLHLAAIRSYCSHRPLLHSHPSTAAVLSRTLYASSSPSLPVSSQPLRFYSRKQKRTERSKQESDKDSLSNKDIRALQRLKNEHRGTEQRLIKEAEEEERDDLEEQMAELEPLTAEQRAEAQAEIERLQSRQQTGRLLSAGDRRKLAEMEAVLELDASRKAQQKRLQRHNNNTADTPPPLSTSKSDYTGFGDTSLELDKSTDPQYRKLKAQYEEEAAVRQRSRKKRPNRKPFNPLPATYQMDDEFDIPTEVEMDRAEWEEVDDDEQKLMRTYLGFQRLRRNEQKLTRLLQMAKPSKRDMLLLLNEVDALEGKDRRFMERYVGPKLNWEELEDDMDAVYDWIEREESDLPEFVGDSENVEKTRELREEQEGDGEGEQKVVVDKGTINAAGVNVMEEFDNQLTRQRLEAAELQRRQLINRDTEILSREEEREVLLAEKWSELKDREEAEEGVEPIEPRAAMLRDERHDSDVEKMIFLNPTMYELEHEDDEYHDADDNPLETEMEIDLVMDAQSRQRQEMEKADKRTDAQLANERKEAEQQLRELAKDEAVQAFIGKEGVELLMKDKLTADDERRLQAALDADEKELDTLQSLSSVWRMKQELVAEWRALLKACGEKLDERAVHEFMQEDEDSIEGVWRAEDDTLEELDEIEQRELDRAAQAVRKQKRWLADQIKVVGEERVKQAVKSGMLRLKTHTAVQEAMSQLLTEKLEKGQDEAQQLEEVMENELEGLDEQLAGMFGMRPEDVKKLRDGQKVDESKLFLSAEELALREKEARPAVYKQIGEEIEDSIRSWIERDLLAEADVAKHSGDAVAAKKLRLMHARRLEYENQKDTRQSSVSSDQLREKGKILEGERSVPSIQHALYGRISVEEAEVNRQLIARGDAHNPRFIDEVDEEAKLSSFSPAEEEVEAIASDGVEQRKDPAQLALEWSAMSDEQRTTISDAVEKENRDANEEFDHFVLSQVPIRMQYKALRGWNNLSEADQKRVTEQGRANREELRHWMWERATQYSEEGEAIDPLSQYWIDEPDPKLHGAIEGAFWHVGRWGLDERTDAEKRASDGKRIVRRHAPVTPDTQTLLDEAERKLFPPEPKEDEEDDTREVDIDVKEDEQLEDGSEEEEGVDADSAIDLEEHFEEAPEVVSEFDELNEALDDPDDDNPSERNPPIAGSSNPYDEDEEAMAAYGEEEESTSVVREKDGFIEYYEDSEQKHEDVDETDGPAEEESELDDDDDEDVEVERNPSNNLDQELFNPRTKRLKEQRDERRRKFEDLDPVPTGDQRAFDDQYFHYDEDEYALVTKLDPWGDTENAYRKPQSLDTVWNEYTQQDEKGQHVLAEETRKALWLLHQSQPSVWTPAALATKFRMSHQHVKAILMIEAASERQVDHQREKDDSEFAQTEDEEEADELHDYKALGDAIKFRESLIRRGDNGEMIELYENEGVNEVHTEAMLHYLPRLPHPRVPDVRFVNENELAAVLEEEREVEERFLSQQAKLAKRESEHFARQGPMGSTTAPRYTRKTDPNDSYQQPAVLKDGKLLPPIPHHLVMVDISERRQDRYSMAVRDVTGWLRQPTPIEFVNARRRERSDKARFVYVEYRQEKDTPV